MAFNDAKPSIQLPLSVFGGLCTENAPVNLPEGVSPDNQDVGFRPGAVHNRPGLSKVFTVPFGTVTVNYGKSYIAPDGTIINLYLDSAGNLWIENVSLAPGTHTMLATTTPGSYAKSVTAFGREYIAISDGLHGQEVPLQFFYDPVTGTTQLDRVTQDGPGSQPSVANVVLPSVALAGTSLSRTANVVTANTASPHGLKPGYMAQVSGVTAEPLSLITSITINNADNPGIATVVTATSHNYAAGMFVSISGIPPAVFGTSISSLTRAGGIVTVTMTSGITISAGAIVTISGTGNNSIDGISAVVSQVPTVNSFVFFQNDTTDIASGSITTGSAKLVFPNLQAPANNLSEIIAVPSGNSFQIQLDYISGVWPGNSDSGAFTPWDGTFFVKSVPTTTTFTYQQLGVDDATTNSGTVSPVGQVSPGAHQMQVLFQTRQGYITAPSPPVRFQANGTQYLQVTNIPIGPSNVVARILAFTGADGAYFFYIPVPAQVSGQQVSTATQINDNTTTTAFLDFSDNTLFASIGINTPGNNLPSQIVLDSALGFGYFDSRLIAYGQRNRINNLLNIGFNGGALPSAPTIPTGWTAGAGGGGAGGALATGRFGGQAWAMNGSGGSIFQSFYQDAYGAPIGTANTKYKLRAYMNANGTATVTISSVIGAFTLTAAISGIGWQEANFSASVGNIPPDTILSLSGTGTISEISIIYAQRPFLDTILFGSYVNNPEGFDGLTGKFGPSDDSRKVMDFGLIRENLFLLTQDPSGRIHSVSSNSFTEPAGWVINEIAANCGALSAFSVTRSQADDASGSGGEEWISWASSSGARIFSGDIPYKISQEIQPDWQSINIAAALTIWGVNDPVDRVIYFGLPTGTNTSPNLIYPVDYKELDTAYQIAISSPIHTSFSGKLIATDHVRKWTRWNLAMNGAALMYRRPGQTQPVLFAGKTFGNVYTLTLCNIVDDDYGTIAPQYTTYFFTTADLEQAVQLGATRKMLTFFQFYATGIGHVQVTPLCDTVANPWPIICERNLSLAQAFDLEWPGASATAQRMAFKFEWFFGTL